MKQQRVRLLWIKIILRYAGWLFLAIFWSVLVVHKVFTTLHQRLVALDSVEATVVIVWQIPTLSGLSPSSVLGILLRFSLWNLDLCRHPPNISDLELINLLESVLWLSKIWHLSLMHREQLLLPNVFMQLIGFPCHRVSILSSSRTAPAVTPFSFFKVHCKMVSKGI